MGRRKIDTTCKLPDSKINSTFSKRKKGAANKVKQLGKLCDVDVVLIAFHPRKDAVIAVSHGGTVADILRRFHAFQQGEHDKIQYSEELRMPGTGEGGGGNDMVVQQPMHPHPGVLPQVNVNMNLNMRGPVMGVVGMPVVMGHQMQDGYNYQEQGNHVGGPHGNHIGGDPHAANCSQNCLYNAGMQQDFRGNNNYQ